MDALITVIPRTTCISWKHPLGLYQPQRWDATTNLAWFLRFPDTYVDDLNTIMASLKFADDVAQTEIMDQSHTTRMQFADDQTSQWPCLNSKRINSKKTARSYCYE